MLPLGPPAEGGCPYQCFSAFAGNPNLISPDELIREGLLRRSEVNAPRAQPGRVDFEAISKFKESMLRRAWENWRAGRGGKLSRVFADFRRAHSHWLEDYALFMALKEAHPAVPWSRWPRALVRRRKSALREARQSLREAIERISFAQFLFHRQLSRLREYAAEKNVKLLGDLPMFVALDSADVWANPHLFKLNADRLPRVVAGVPPDYFSADGQRWGNPLYNWRAMSRDRFDWWKRRIRSALEQADAVRIDHFRGLEACWEIPASSPTARTGRWVKSPGRHLLAAFQKEFHGLPFIAEDLGLITPAVERLRKAFGLPGMRVMQFGFEGGAGNPHLPHNYDRHVVAYTATHDNNTTAGWFTELPRKHQSQVIQYLGCARREIVWQIIRAIWASAAAIAIVSVQDLLELGSSARMNVPGTSKGNWSWRIQETKRLDGALDRVAQLSELYARQPLDEIRRRT